MLSVELVRGLDVFDANWFAFLIGLDAVERAVVYEHELNWFDSWCRNELTLEEILTLIDKELTV